MVDGGWSMPGWLVGPDGVCWTAGLLSVLVCWLFGGWSVMVEGWLGGCPCTCRSAVAVSRSSADHSTKDGHRVTRAVHTKSGLEGEGRSDQEAFDAPIEKDG
jgi:hypothetical protein